MSGSDADDFSEPGSPSCSTSPALTRQKHRLLVRFLRLAHRKGLLTPLAVGLPLLAFVSMVGTVAVCWTWYRQLPSTLPGRYFPAISELALEMPGKLVYQAGFASCGLMLSVGFVLYQELIVVEFQRLPQESRAAIMENTHQALRWAHISAAGVAIQGIFTLEKVISARCFVHWAGAIMFIVGAMSHAKASSAVYELAHQLDLDLMKSKTVINANYFRQGVLKFSSFSVFLIPLFYQAMRLLEEAPAAPASGPDAERNLAGENAMGLAQWSIIFQFAVYYLSYAADLFVASRLFYRGRRPSGLGHPMCAAAAAAVAVPRAARAAAARAAAATAGAAACMKASRGSAFG